MLKRGSIPGWVRRRRQNKNIKSRKNEEDENDDDEDGEDEMRITSDSMPQTLPSLRAASW